MSQFWRQKDQGQMAASVQLGEGLMVDSIIVGMYVEEITWQD
jgi:hypothetical protein